VNTELQRLIQSYSIQFLNICYLFLFLQPAVLEVINESNMHKVPRGNLAKSNNFSLCFDVNYTHANVIISF